MIGARSLQEVSAHEVRYQLRRRPGEPLARARPAGGGVGLRPGMELGLPRALERGVHAARLPGGEDRAARARDVRDEPAHARRDRARKRVRNAEAGVRWPACDLRHRQGRQLGPPDEAQPREARRSRADDRRRSGARPRQPRRDRRRARPDHLDGRRLPDLRGRLRAERATSGRPQGRRRHLPDRRPVLRRMGDAVRAGGRRGGRARPCRDRRPLRDPLVRLRRSRRGP